MKLKAIVAAIAMAPVLSVVPAAVHATAAPNTICTYPPKSSHLSIALSQSLVKKGTKITIFGLLRSNNCLLVGATIKIDKEGKLFATVSTNRSGNYSDSFTATKSAHFYAIFPGNKHGDTTASRQVYLHVKKGHHHKKKHHKKH